MTLCFNFIDGGLGTCAALTVSPITNLTGWLGKPFLFISPSDLIKSSCGWMKASLITANVLFQRIYQLLNDTNRMRNLHTKLIHVSYNGLERWGLVSNLNKYLYIDSYTQI